ncbi:type IV secretory system conjugative DNA transfer family protein [Patescibacteria group bacterium]
MKEEKKDEVVAFALTNFRNVKKKFGILPDDRRRHIYVIGKTGMGKSTLIENMIIQDIRNGKGVALIDPLGDLVERVIKYIPADRINDVVYINPADLDHPIAFNVLEAIDPSHHHLVASGLIGVFKKLWIDSWGPRLEYVLRNTILSLLEYPGSTLLGVTRLLVDKKYRQKVVAKLTDPIIKAFWLDEFNAYSNQFRTEAISPIQNKVGQFLSSPVIRNIVGQPKSTIDMRDIMDSGKILLLNLSKGRIGEDNSSLLGAMMITKLQLAAMSRIDTPETNRRDFYMFVDEFQNFATESFATILSEARKYRLNILIAHQYIEQLDETVQAAVFGNVGTIVAFRIGAADAEFLVKEFEPIFSETDLVNLTKYDVYLRLMIDGVASDPFSATTLPPLSGEVGNQEKIIQASRERYSNDREKIEEKITRWSGVEETYKATAEEDNLEANRHNNIRKAQAEDLHRSADKNIDLKKISPGNLKPVINQPEKDTISLSEAIKTGPVSFSGKRKKSDKDRNRKNNYNQPRTDKKNINKKDFQNNSSQFKPISPGQVVKF